MYKLDTIELTNLDIMAAQQVLEYLRSRKLGGIAQYSVVDVDYNLVKLDNTACIAMLSDYYYETKCVPRLCIYMLCRKDGNDNWIDIATNRIKFLDYLINRSFAKDCYILKEHFNVNKNQCVVTRCDVPNSIFGFANNLLRIGFENNLMLNSWCRLVDGGVNEDLAFLMCQYTKSDVKGGIVSFDNLGYWDHSVMYDNSNTTFADILKGKNTIIKTFGETSFQEDPRYAVQYILNGGSCFLAEIKKSCSYIKVRTDAVLDLMGDVVEKPKDISGFTVNELNIFWEEW